MFDALLVVESSNNKRRKILIVMIISNRWVMRSKSVKHIRGHILVQRGELVVRLRPFHEPCSWLAYIPQVRVSQNMTLLPKRQILVRRCELLVGQKKTQER